MGKYTAIDDPSAHFQAATYSGTGSSGNAITNDGNSDLQPDFVWIKVRTYNNDHVLQDSSRGFAGSGEVNVLRSNSTVAEGTNGAFASFDTNGFEVGGTNPASRSYNGSSDTYAAWQWKANGGTTSSNTDGSITSTVQANQDAGFSIVTYTGTGVYNQTVGHGLGATPAVVIVKNRTSADTSYDDWWVFHHKTSNPINRVLALNETAAEVSSTVFWSVLPSSTIFGVGGNTNPPRYTNADSDDYVAYCFAEKQGFSKFGKYKGNGVGTGDGPFVYLGFKPAFLLLKNITNANNWRILDNKRLGYNPNNYRLSANALSSESTTEIWADLLSNGFKLRTNEGSVNAANTDYIYMAFAENPFVTSTGIPTTAR